MFETLIAPLGSANNKTYPWSGPGPKTLMYGDETIGYFGEANAQELLSVFNLRDQLNFQVGTDSLAWEGRWIKMFVDGKVIFFPTQVIATGITWNDLYNAGIVYGTDDNGKYPTATPTNQLRYVSAGTTVMKVRNFKVLSVDPTTLGGGENFVNTTQTTVLNGEWYRTVASITTPKIATYNGPWWPRYASNSILIPNVTPPFPVGQETASSNLSVTGFTNTTMTFYAKTSPQAWYPVLEVVRDATYLFPLAHLTGFGTTGPFTTGSAVAESSFEKPTNFSGSSVDVAPPASNAHAEFV